MASLECYAWLAWLNFPLNNKHLWVKLFENSFFEFTPGIRLVQERDLPGLAAPPQSKFHFRTEQTLLIQIF